MKPVYFCTKCRTVILDTKDHQDHKTVKLTLSKIASVLLILVVAVSFAVRFKKVAVEYVFSAVIGYLSSKLGKG